MSRKIFYVEREVYITSVDKNVKRPIILEHKRLIEPMSYIPPIKEIEFDWYESLGNVIKQVEEGKVQAEVAYMKVPEIPELEIHYDIKTGCAIVYYNGIKCHNLLSSNKHVVTIKYSEYFPTLQDMMDRPFEEVITYVDSLRNRRKAIK